MSRQLVKVPFHGDELDAAYHEGFAHASLRQCCDNLGLDYDSQLKRLKRQRWGTTVMMAAVAKDGKQREIVMIRADRIPMWLAGVDVGRIGRGKSKEIRQALQEKIALYQDEAAKVLADHFLGRPQTIAQPTVTLADVEQIVRRVLGEVRQHPTLPGPHWTVNMRLDERYPEWKTTAKQRATIRRKTIDLIRTLCPGMPIEYYNRDVVFVNVQVTMLDKVIDREHRLEEKRGGVDNWGLFHEITDM